MPDVTFIVFEYFPTVLAFGKGSVFPAPNVSNIFCNALLIVSLKVCLCEVNFAGWALDWNIPMSLFIHVFDEVFCKVGLEWTFSAKEYAKKMLFLHMKKE